MSSKNCNPIKNILVVGDWVVDDFWITSIHRSPTASRTGRAHYRSLHGSTENTVQALCGAGRTASVLYRAHRFRKPDQENSPLCNVFGLGLWHEADTDELQAMLESNNNFAQNPLRLTRRKTEKPDRVHLHNLAGHARQHPQFADKAFGTARMIRVYQNTGTQTELLHRVDWELEIDSDHIEAKRPVLIGENDEQWQSCLIHLLSSSGLPRVDAIVVKDLCKGVVSRGLVKVLKQCYPDKPWFVSTKAWHGESRWSGHWLELLKDVDLRLLIIPQVAAQTAIRNGELSCWITRSGHPSNEAVTRLSELLDSRSRQNRTVLIVLPNGMSLLATDSNAEDRELVVQTEPRPTDLEIDVAMASVFLPASVLQLLENPDLPLDSLAKRSLAFTREWKKREVSRLMRMDGARPKPEEALDLSTLRSMEPVGDWRSDKWSAEVQTWQDALSNLGIIGSADEPRIELWRAMTDLNGYACCDAQKRSVVRRISRHLDSFTRNFPERNFSCLILADPGSGKTRLVEQMAKSFNFRYLGFNITQLTARNEILDCLDTIVTTQAQDRKQPVMVFFDEINAKLVLRPVYDAFLAPLDEGTYLRAGKTFKLDPCVWVFAGTEHPEESKDRNGDHSQKASDFVSRLTIDPQRIGGSVNRLENVYIGCALIKNTFPDVSRVSEKMLNLFHTLPADLAVRDMAHMVRALANVQYGKVSSSNMQPEWLRKLRKKTFDVENWETRNEGPYVNIIA